jgi:cytochrome c1
MRRMFLSPYLKALDFLIINRFFSRPFSVRRGYQVYREVCSACHSLDRIAWRNLIDVSHSDDEVKTMAEEVEYEDGPDDEGEMFQRPGKVNKNKANFFYMYLL